MTPPPLLTLLLLLPLDLPVELFELDDELLPDLLELDDELPNLVGAILGVRLMSSDASSR